MKKIVPLLLLLTACHPPEDYYVRQQEQRDDGLCIKRGGDYDKCRASLIEEREVCRKRWYAKPQQERIRLNDNDKEKKALMGECEVVGYGERY